ncbi:UDP-glycosyltransferase 87A2-like isoform X2 [Prunus avium]|uniref:UDP-glycosyltransferase 87A2-like isoform X2 n=1 Tax=Prunus avium TaxID=42229 RepID=A0A6P5S0M9_PRUAV|nr:UDP-glycosyltransferase 87A2-like isoform X2 [Prunus avium]
MKSDMDSTRELESPPTSVCHVVALPYPGRGHINPMMNLCKLLSSKKPDTLITFVVTEEWHGFMGSDQKPHNIRFATVPNLIPSELVRANDFLGFMEAVNTKLEAPVEQLLDRLEQPVSAIVADPFVVWATRVASRRNIPVASLWPMSASVFSVLLHIETLEQKGYFPLNNVSDSQPKHSVLYISLGSFLSVSKAQMDEIVAGVQNSGARFLWVARGDASKLKDGVGDKGLVVSWCDQLRVLCHDSIGGFWSHCGWNSTLEAVYAGVPILTCPIFGDQILNAKKIVEDWKIGCRVLKKKKKGFEEEDLVTREEIVQLVQRFMDLESKEGNEMRERAKQLQETCQGAIAKGGSSDTNLNAFIKDVFHKTIKQFMTLYFLMHD